MQKKGRREFDRDMGWFANEYELKLMENNVDIERCDSGVKVNSAKSLCFGNEYVTVDMHDGKDSMVFPLRSTWNDLAKRNKFRIHINMATVKEDLNYDNARIFDAAQLLNKSIENASMLVEALQEYFIRVPLENLIVE